MNDRKLQIILAIIAVAIIAVFFFPPLAQDLSYHQFADDRVVSGVNNFWNVASNFLFLIVGLLGVFTLVARPTEHLPKGALPIYWFFFTSLILVSLGSGYYHLDPNNPTLVWDRLPMTLAFMAFFCAIIGEFISYSLAQRLLVPLVLLGMLSVGYWAYTEEMNRGDLRFYVVIQFLPMLLIPLILFLYKGNSQYSPYIWYVLAGYVLSKLFEFWDQPIYEITGGISGHALKHVAAALGTFFFYLLVRSRQKAE
jgi:hypothetical protein